MALEGQASEDGTLQFDVEDVILMFADTEEKVCLCVYLYVCQPLCPWQRWG